MQWISIRLGLSLFVGFVKYRYKQKHKIIHVSAIMATAPMLVTATIIVDTSNISGQLVEGIGILVEGVEKLDDDE